MGAEIEKTGAVDHGPGGAGGEVASALCNQSETGELSGSLELLVNKLDQINSTLVTIAPPDGVSVSQFGAAIFIAVIGAFTAYVFNFFHWRMVRKKHYFGRIADILNIHIHELERLAVRYWVSCYEEHEKQSIEIDEISIKAKLRLISRYTKKLGPLLDVSRYRELADELSSFSQDIFDEASGGDFESSRRKEDPKRAQIVSRLCADMQAKLVFLED
ncbi:MAG: hypothetical protein IT490_01145 [Candidatus Contendobacter sp.]|nr:hypothetical protein [Candidatus Contendobacter sp.]